MAPGTGARRGELAKLHWSDIDFTYNRITFRDTKTGDDRTIPLPPALVELIKECGRVRPIDPQARLFPHEFHFDWREVKYAVPNCASTIRVTPWHRILQWGARPRWISLP